MTTEPYSYKNIVASGLLATRPGRVGGIIVNSHTSGTLALVDGTEGSAVAASSVITSSGACVPAVHASSIVTSSGTNVAGSHVLTTLTESGGNFVDGAYASGYLTSDNSQPTAGNVVVLGSRTYTWVALGGTQVNTPTAVNVPLGNNAVESFNNLYNAMLSDPLVSVVRTSGLVITVTALAIGTAGNITATENDSHTAWDNGSTLTGGANAETFTIGTTVYTWKTALTGAAYEVLIGATVTASLLNAKNAINADSATLGKTYGFGTAAHPDFVCTSSDATTFVIRGRVPGTSLNATATTETCAHASWAGATANSGTPGITTAGATITIGAIVYTQVVELSETLGAVAIPYQFLRGASEATSLDNFKLAVNAGSGVGTSYSTGTVAHQYVIATTNTDTAQTVVARTVGTAAFTAIVNALATTETGANLAWEATTLGAGTGASVTQVTSDAATFTIGTRTYTAVKALDETSGATAVVDQILWVTSEAVFLDNVKATINLTGTAGTTYSTGTTINADVYATTNTNTAQTIVARIMGTVGNAIATTTTLGNYAWTSTVLTSGAGATGRLIMNTFTFVAGSSVQMFGAGGINFATALSAVVGGVADITLLIS